MYAVPPQCLLTLEVLEEVGYGVALIVEEQRLVLSVARSAAAATANGTHDGLRMRRLVWPEDEDVG